MNEIISNWYLYVIAIVIGVIIGGLIYNFIKLPSSAKKEKIKEWLIWAVSKAEKELGSGTGKLKLRYVYDMFVTKFEFISKFMSFKDFSNLVDEALEEFNSIISSNQKVKNYIEEK